MSGSCLEKESKTTATFTFLFVIPVYKKNIHDSNLQGKC